MNSTHLKDFTKLYENLSMVYGSSTVFMDMVKMFAISLYNSFAINEIMEKEYLRTINSYKKEHQALFPQIFAHLIMMYEESGDIIDILGPLYEQSNLGNKHLGQFFTPSHISDFMAEITLQNEEEIKTLIDKNGYITMNEPTCGAGGMILSFAKSLKNKNINYQKDLLVIANDISDICAYMTYIQLSLYEIPAIVYCEDTLSQELRFKMETPRYYIHLSKFKSFYLQENNTNHSNKIVIQKPIENTFKEVAIKGISQISLW